MADQGNHQDADWIDRRGSLICMAWAVTRKGAIDKRWQSFDYQGVHFIGLVNEAKHSAVAGKRRLFHRHSATFDPESNLKCKAFLAATSGILPHQDGLAAQDLRGRRSSLRQSGTLASFVFRFCALRVQNQGAAWAYR